MLRVSYAGRTHASLCELRRTSRQIDRLVYELYELTDEEITLVEQSS